MIEERRPRLLIVDDAAPIVEALCAALATQGYDAIGFADPHEAIGALREGKRFELLLADLMMPGMDGVALLREAHLHDPDLVGIIMTGEGTIVTAVEAMKSGALDYVLKPLKLNVILPVLSRALSVRDLRIENAALERSVRERTDELEKALGDLERETSERLRVEQALMQAQKLEAISRLTGGVAHDFNNLLMAIDGAFQLLDRHLDPHHSGRKYIEAGRVAAARGSKVTSALLAFSRTQRLDLQPTDICAAMRNAAPTFAHALGPTISFDLQVASGSVWAYTDVGQLELAIVNLATNARDAMPDGGKAVLGVAREDAPDGQPIVAISLHDTGTGMPPETAACALDPFFTTKARGKGSGLGLAQVYAFARQCGGEVAIVSNPGEGTTVRITLPQVPEPLLKASGMAGNGDNIDLPLVTASGIHLLVVDDDDAVRTILVDGLRFQGFDVSEAANGAAALKELKSRIPHALVVDYAMPCMSGEEVALHARALTPDLPVIFCSGYADTSALDSVEGARVLRKPIAVSALARTVMELVGATPAGTSI